MFVVIHAMLIIMWKYYRLTEILQSAKHGDSLRRVLVTHLGMLHMMNIAVARYYCVSSSCR